MFNNNLDIDYKKIYSIKTVEYQNEIFILCQIVSLLAIFMELEFYWDLDTIGLQFRLHRRWLVREGTGMHTVQFKAG